MRRRQMRIRPRPPSARRTPRASRRFHGDVYFSFIKHASRSNVDLRDILLAQTAFAGCDTCRYDKRRGLNRDIDDVYHLRGIEAAALI